MIYIRARIRGQNRTLDRVAQNEVGDYYNDVTADNQVNSFATILTKRKVSQNCGNSLCAIYPLCACSNG